MTSGNAASDITISLHYSDTAIDEHMTTVPDWFFTIPAPSTSLYYLIDDLDRASGDASFYEPGVYAIFGFGIDPDATRTLESVTIRQTSLTGQLAFFGATAVRQSHSVARVRL